MQLIGLVYALKLDSIVFVIKHFQLEKCFHQMQTHKLLSWWQLGQEKFVVYHRNKRWNFICTLLLLCDDIESCPGPICQKNNNRDIPEFHYKHFLPKFKKSLFKHKSDSNVVPKLSWYRCFDDQQNAYRKIRLTECTLRYFWLLVSSQTTQGWKGRWSWRKHFW